MDYAGVKFNINWYSIQQEVTNQNKLCVCMFICTYSVCVCVCVAKG